MAVGAGRARIIRQLLTESCVLAVLGGSAGYLLTTAAWRILPAMAPVSIPRLAAARADWTILLFTIALALVTGMLFGMAPALRSAAARDFTARGAASGRHDRTRAALVMGEVAIAVALVLVGAQLLGNFIALLRTGPGFDADRVLASVVLPAPERYQTPEQRAAVYRRFLDAVRAIPGVAKAGTVDALPFSGENHGGFINVNRVAGRFIAEIDIVGGDYLQTLGLHLASGRWFREEEMKSSSETAILNDIAAQHLWPGENAIGKQICIDCTPENPNNWKRVVGVVSSVRHADLDAPPGFNVYLSARALEAAAFLVVRTDRPVRGLDQTIQRAIASVDPDQPVLLSASMQSLISDTIADRRFVMRLLAVTGCLALLMSIAGIYGVTSYTASRRTQEIGVRMALGATPGSVHALLFRQGFLTVIAGLAAGILIALASTHALHGIMVGFESQNTKNFWMAACLVGLTAAAACWIPARRAIRIDPMSALRQE
jgi:putative ABC transport system permease protein